MQKCSLCGGRVVNGRCEECGLPIPPEHNYTLRGESAHYHRVNGEDVLHRVRPRGSRPEVDGYAEEERTAHVHESGTDRHEAPRPTVHTALYNEKPSHTASNARATATGCFVIVVALMVILPMLFSYFSKAHYLGGGGFLHDSTTETDAPSVEKDSYDPYEDLRGQVAEAGTVWEGELTPGLYIVGQDLPAGSYSIECTDENTGISMEYVNDEYAVWAYEDFYGYDSDSIAREDIPMPDGTIFFLDGRGSLQFHTDNSFGYALPVPENNPNAGQYYLSAAAEADPAKCTVGEDIAPGIYDVVVASGDNGYFSFEYPTQTAGTMYCGTFLSANGQNTLQHIILQQGTTVSVQSFGQYDFVVELLPSEFAYQ